MKDDIEAEISKEVQGIQGSKQEALFVPVKIDVQCGKSALDADNLSVIES